MELIIILILILLNGLFSMSEIAMISARKSNLSAEAKKGSSSAKRALQLAEEPDRFLSTVQIGITLIGILTGLYSGDKFAEDFSEILVGWGMNASIALGVSKTIIVVIVTYLTLIIGELLPKRIGMNYSERIAKVVAGPMHLLSLLTSPFVWILTKSTALLSKMIGLREEDPIVTEEEIKSMIAEGAEDGSVQEMEQDIVERVFSLGDRKVESIMTSRNEIVWIEKEMTAEDISDLIKENLFEVYPVGNDSLDDILGVVFLKELFAALDQPDFKLSDIIRPAQYFHEYTDVYKVLEQMQEKQVAYGLVCDEFGVFQGIVTHKDILEGLVGAISDDEQEPDIIERKEENSWLVDGQIPFYDFLEHFECEDLFAENDYNTLGGLILEKLEHIPLSGESLQWEDFQFEVVDMDGARIDKILVKKIERQVIETEE